MSASAHLVPIMKYLNFTFVEVLQHLGFPAVLRPPCVLFASLCCSCLDWTQIVFLPQWQSKSFLLSVQPHKSQRVSRTDRILCTYTRRFAQPFCHLVGHTVLPQLFSLNYSIRADSAFEPDPTTNVFWSITWNRTSKIRSWSGSSVSDWASV